MDRSRGHSPLKVGHFRTFVLRARSGIIAVNQVLVVLASTVCGNTR